MALKEWTSLSEETLHRNPWWTYKRDTFALPSGEEGEYHYVTTPGSVMLVPCLPDGRFLLVRQYRYLNRRVSIEFPAGGIKSQQAIVEAARAELREEAGVEAGTLNEIGQFNPFNGVTDELCHVFAAADLKPVQAEPDVTEEFEILDLSEDEIAAAIVDGTLWDGMTLAAWSMYRATLLLCLVFFFLSVSGNAQVRCGADLLLSDSLHLIEGRRIGLLANHTSRLSNGVLLFDTLLTRMEITLAVVFSPEHGFRGTAADGEIVASGQVAGVPLHSLYGASRRPTQEMLQDIDVLVMDLQDIGSRYYTYLSTMAICLEEASAAGVPVIVCDRPNPVGGVLIEGPVREEKLRSFVGYLPLPVRHGLTAGEALRMAIGERWLGSDVPPSLTVIPCAGWRRAMYYDETGLPWVRPSPNIASLEAAIGYAGSCLLEGTNMSEGRGTDTPFLTIGAPFINADSLSAEMNGKKLAGVRFEPAAFTPTPRTGAPNPKYNGQHCGGLRIEITDRKSFLSFSCGVELLETLRSLYGAFLSVTPYLDTLAGVPRFNELSVSAVSRRSADDVRRFTAKRLPYLLYH